VVKFVPFTVKVNPVAPAVIEVGEMLVSVGARLMVNTAADVVPPTVVTVTLTVPELAIPEAGTAAWSSVALTYVVDSAVPPQFTVEPEVKFVPVTVSVNAAPPAIAEAGEMLVSVGATLIV
jgi:hypothetical protein